MRIAKILLDEFSFHAAAGGKSRELSLVELFISTFSYSNKWVWLVFCFFFTTVAESWVSKMLETNRWRQQPGKKKSIPIFFNTMYMKVLKITYCSFSKCKKMNFSDTYCHNRLESAHIFFQIKQFLSSHTLVEFVLFPALHHNECRRPQNRWVTASLSSWWKLWQMKKNQTEIWNLCTPLPPHKGICGSWLAIMSQDIYIKKLAPYSVVCFVCCFIMCYFRLLLSSEIHNSQVERKSIR